MTVEYHFPVSSTATPARVDGVVIGVLLDVPGADAPVVAFLAAPAKRASPRAPPPRSPVKTSAPRSH